MSATTLTSTPVIDALMAAISCLSREEQVTLVEQVQGKLMEEDFPQWQMDIVEERLRSLENGTAELIPMEDVFAELDAKWGARS
jgi:hypothetical protein